MIFVSYSFSCMVSKVVLYLIVDLFNTDICNIHICYHQLVVHFQRYSVHMAHVSKLGIP